MADETGPTGGVAAHAAERPAEADAVATADSAPDDQAGWGPGGSEEPPVPVLPLSRRGRFGRSRPAVTEPQADWRWVEEWRRGGEPTPWGPGLFLAGFAGLIIGSAVYVITTGLADNVVLAIVANVVVALGLAPALWMSRALPVLRWVALGGALGTVVAWISLAFFPLVR